MIPRHLHQFWVGPIEPEIAGMMSGVKLMHPDWTVFWWDDKTIERLGLDFNYLLARCKNMAGVSNVVRLHAVNQLGGVWIDSDCEMLKPIDPLLENSAFVAEQDAGRTCNACFGAVPQHPWIEWQIKHQERLMCEDAAEGVYVMSEAPRDGVTIVPTSYFYPFLWDTPLDERMAHPDSFMLHHWSGSWKK